MVISQENKIISFSESIDLLEKPIHFPSPFNQPPHHLSKLASAQLISYLENEQLWKDIPLFTDLKAHKRIGKMFGVLVVEDKQGDVGFLAAFSGKLLGENQYALFVSPVFDMLEENGFYRKEEHLLLDLSRRISILEKSPDFIKVKSAYNKNIMALEEEWETTRKNYKSNKLKRSQQKEALKKAEFSLSLEEEEYLINKEGLKANYAFKKEKQVYKERCKQARTLLTQYEENLQSLKIERKNRSKNLQQKLYEQYQFLNKDMEVRNLESIFSELDIPPSGSGECAAPKLLHHAFKYGLKPLCMAEFWWGRSPNSNQKIQGEYYPPCEEKCRPILGHMLKGMI